MKSNDNQIYQAEIVHFYGHEIPCIRVGEQPFVVVGSICEAIGLHAQSAYEAIKKDEILGSLYGVHRMGLPNSTVRKRFTLPIDRVEGWLFSIELGKVKPEVQPILIEFKRECYRALHEYFNGSHATLRKMCLREKQLIDENSAIRSAMAYMNRRLKNNEAQLLLIRKNRFEAFRLFDPEKTEDERLEQVFSLVDELKGQPMLETSLAEM